MIRFRPARCSRTWRLCPCHSAQVPDHAVVAPYPPAKGLSRPSVRTFVPSGNAVPACYRTCGSVGGKAVPRAAANLTPAQVVSIFTGKTRNWSQVPGATRQRHDRPDQPHLGRGRADQLPDAAAGRQESLEPLATEESSEGLLRAGSRKRPRTRSASCPTTRRISGSSTRSATTAWPATSRPWPAGQYAGIARFYEVTRGPATELRGVVHQLDHEIGGRAQDHLQPVGAGAEHGSVERLATSAWGSGAGPECTGAAHPGWGMLGRGQPLRVAVLSNCATLAGPPRRASRSARFRCLWA